ncbi:MAG: RuBisCO large subunit C-terminal-like domain-containing protein [Candidatus Goldbacteria bacterium]|nr:RuBisCO large subunit C-terminal-like domain-containing protein [Candidatus Goldiibacteriota bacterium]
MFSVCYILKSTKDEIKKKVFEICVEQTIEFPYHLVKKSFIKKNIVGKIKSIKQISKNLFKVIISYNEITVGNDFTQFLNVLFGNTSLKPHIKLEKIFPSKNIIKKFKGPVFGIEGIRKILKAYNRPILATAIKPMGLTPSELANLAYQFALGGIDIIKDDHGLANQSFSPFKQRVKKVCNAIKKTGKNCLYAPNITADTTDEIIKRAQYAKKCGAGALVISPGLTGLAAINELANKIKINLPILFHPAFLGGWTASKNTGISHYALYGQLARLSGADIVIFPNFGGRFSLTKQECKEIENGCKDKMLNIKPAFPAPAGGMTLDKIKELKKFYGNDVVFLVGGALVEESPDIIKNCLKFKNLII